MAKKNPSVVEPSERPDDTVDTCTEKTIGDAIKRKLSDDFTGEPCKKRKYENTESECCEEEEKSILGALLSVKRLGRVIQLQILYEYGERDCPQQILQYLKNNLV